MTPHSIVCCLWPRALFCWGASGPYCGGGFSVCDSPVEVKRLAVWLVWGVGGVGGGGGGDQRDRQMIETFTVQFCTSHAQRFD